MSRLRATRISYMGELGWELYVPSEFATGALRYAARQWRAAWAEAGGMHAMDSLRIEKAYRHWGHDITDEDTPLEAGLGFAVAFDKNADFIGRDALLKQKAEKKLVKRLLQFALEDPAPLLYHNEPIYRDGELVGHTSSAAYGHHLGRAIAMGYVKNEAGVDADWVASGKWEIEVASTRHAARASLMADVRSDQRPDAHLVQSVISAYWAANSQIGSTALHNRRCWRGFDAAGLACSL